MPNQNAQKNEPAPIKREPLSKGVSDDAEKSGSVYSRNLMTEADTEVRENEDASLQDDSYSFDEDNTDNEEYHDVDDATDLTDLFESDDDLQ